MSKVTLLNDLYSELDTDVNGHFYDQETLDTGVVYRVFNIMNNKSYIGKAFSYEKHGDKKPTYYGAKGRFKRHLSNSKSKLAENECPIFYEALRNSDINDWFVFTLKVCSKKHLKEWETKLIKEHQTSDPVCGYNYFVGDNKPDSKVHLAKYQNSKAESNAKRAIGGGLRRQDHSKNLPPNINYRITRKPDGTVKSEGYFVQIKIGGKLYSKAFLSNKDTMEAKLRKAQDQLKLFKQDATKKPGSKTSKKL